jgi:FKBP-type peptidyl-prolyl cis-trans isomerase 2
MVLLDSNHPLAGKEISVEVELLAIVGRCSGVAGA